MKKPGRRVLIVEDNLDAGEAMASLLQADGYQVRVATEGAGALQIAAQFKPQTAILDIGLPGVDGYGVARKLRELDPALVLIALSGWHLEPGDNRAREAGFKHYLTKPLDADRLSKLLAEM